MNIHEYQAKALLAKFGVVVPNGGVAYTPQEAVSVAKELGGPVWVVKAQIHAGGRGKGGGVKIVNSIDGVEEAANDLIGMKLVTHQTGPEGREVNRVYVEDSCDIARELYLGILVNRETSRVTLMGSTEGGMEIEQIAADTPNMIIMESVDPASGIQPFHARKLAYGLKLGSNQVKSAESFIVSVFNAFIELDASVIEINPLVVTGTGELVALDAGIFGCNRSL